MKNSIPETAKEAEELLNKLLILFDERGSGASAQEVKALHKLTKIWKGLRIEESLTRVLGCIADFAKEDAE